jgi:hypothetical protein
MADAPKPTPYVVSRHASSRDAKKTYEVSHCDGDYTCSCPGFEHRQACRHVDDAKTRKLTSPLTLSNRSFER